MIILVQLCLILLLKLSTVRCDPTDREVSQRTYVKQAWFSVCDASSTHRSYLDMSRVKRATAATLRQQMYQHESTLRRQDKRTLSASAGSQAEQNDSEVVVVARSWLTRSEDATGQRIRQYSVLQGEHRGIERFWLGEPQKRDGWLVQALTSIKLAPADERLASCCKIYVESHTDILLSYGTLPGGSSAPADTTFRTLLC
ncbi:uncharacterized protein L969DRAFT_495179 [Mixia osmundae IAM 14324]|uniref:uncharacterized protein n=1 Tax=Mixia osmundae (strain CBS 9802 / IAM 14324 / JCM 22182 / KY 12970) TaxID=764103 RepID=UPI0004A5547C|nr:uncharacterized protein L969DRAFT_495179 [Mixia osmundae IAM 14324]KEI38871.1 hypothetical protein L969DRAFT_495179 [Mixia osmundae IAM 14324]